MKNLARRLCSEFIHCSTSRIGVFALMGTLSAQGQQERALFDAPLVVADSQHRLALTLDYNQDGFEDAVSYWWDDDTGEEVIVRVWINDGSGKLVETWSTSYAGGWPGSGINAKVTFTEVDLNQDAYPDFAAIFTHADRASLLS